MARRTATLAAMIGAMVVVQGRLCAQTQPTPAALPRATFAPPQPAAECPVAAAAAIADIPDSVDLVLVVENGTALRTSTVGDAAAGFLAETGVLADVQKAWKALGDQLGWSTQEAFDRLLGRRVVLLSKGLGQGEGVATERRWTILSDVSADTEQVLKERLQAAPRAFSQGHKILTIENGAYELTGHRRGPVRTASGEKSGLKTVRGSRDAEPVTLVLGPAGRGELFDEMLARLSRASDPSSGVKGQVAANNGAVGTLSAHEVFTLACQSGPTEVLLLAALDTPGTAGGAREPWKDFVLLAGHRDLEPREDAPIKPGTAWRSRIVVRQTARREALLKIEPTSDAPFRAISRGAVLATMQYAPLTDVLGPWAPIGSLLSMLPLSDTAKGMMGSGQAMRVRTVGEDRRVSVTFARQTGCTQQLSRQMDGETAATLSRLEKQFGVVTPPPQDYSGVAPNAVRTTPLACSTESALSIFTSRPLTVSWAYPSRPAVNGPINLRDPAIEDPGCCAAGCVGDKRPGWWVLNISQEPKPNDPANVRREPTPSETLRSDANALLLAPPTEGAKGQNVIRGASVARWVWLLGARPQEIDGLLPVSIPDLNGSRSALRRFETIDLALRITEQGDVQGDVGILLAEREGVAK